MNQTMCMDCKFFVQHFVPHKDHYIAACCGHCVYPLIKHRPPDRPACKHFIANGE